MPGGWLHKPIWGPYELYGRVDYVYGMPAWEAKSGWTAAQSWFNVLETAAYLVYLGIVYKYGEPEDIQGTGAPDKEDMGRFKKLSQARTLSGRVAIYAVLLGYSTCFLTFSKTVLYCKSIFCCENGDIKLTIEQGCWKHAQAGRTLVTMIWHPSSSFGSFQMEHGLLSHYTCLTCLDGRSFRVWTLLLVVKRRASSSADYSATVQMKPRSY